MLVFVQLLRVYRTEGLAGLLQWNYHGGRRSKISEAMATALQLRLNDPAQGFHSYGEIQQWLLQEYEAEIPYSTVHQVVRYRMKAKLKVARPTSIHRDEEAVVSFKKNGSLVVPVFNKFLIIMQIIRIPLGR